MSKHAIIKTQGPYQQGFSLIELMIVVALIGILSSFAVPSFTGYLQSAKASTALLALQPWQQGIAFCWQEKGSLSACHEAGQDGIPAIPSKNDELPKGILALTLAAEGVIQATLDARDTHGQSIQIQLRPTLKASLLEWELNCSDKDTGNPRITHCTGSISSS